MKTKILVLAAALAIGGSTFAAAQDRNDHRNDRRNDERGRQQVQQDNRERRDAGTWNARAGNWTNDRDDRRDRDDNRPAQGWRNERVYRGGNVYGDRDGDEYPVYTNQYPVYGQYRVYGDVYASNRTAQQFGYQDGLNAGARDRVTGHSFRPTQWAAYRDADHGLSTVSGYGNASQYKAAYRQAFEQGYERGYQSGY